MIEPRSDLPVVPAVVHRDLNPIPSVWIPSFLVVTS